MRVRRGECDPLVLGLAEIPCALGGICFDHGPGRAHPRQTRGVLGARLDAVKRGLQRCARGRQITLPALQLRKQGTEDAGELRLVHRGTHLGGLVEPFARARVVAQPECQLRAAQVEIDERVADLAPPDRAQDRARELPLARFDRELGAQDHQPYAVRALLARQPLVDNRARLR